MSDSIIFVVGIIVFGLTVYGAVVGGGLALTFRNLRENPRSAPARTPDDSDKAPQPPADEHDYMAVISPSRSSRSTEHREG